MTEEEFLKRIGVKGHLRHARRADFIWLKKNYRIRPDEAFYFEDKVILIEFESNKRLVESISKYWWLFRDTDWRNNQIKLELHFVILKSHDDEIRERSVQILGEELSKQENGFKFFYYE